MAGKRPTRKQKIFIAKKHLDPENWLVARTQKPGELRLISRHSNQERGIKLQGGL